MIGVIIVTHGGLAKEFCLALEHIVGKQSNVIPIGIEPDVGVQVYMHKIDSAIAEVNIGKGVLILTDMFGGTPSNLAVSFIKKGQIEVIAGVNLPMLVKLSTLRASDNLQEVSALVQAAGKKYITVAGSFFSEE